jgi:HSP20 family molecular chaperone IbpA
VQEEQVKRRTSKSMHESSRLSPAGIEGRAAREVPAPKGRPTKRRAAPAVAPATGTAERPRPRATAPAREAVELTTRDSILDELDQLHADVRRRAYELFRTHEQLWIGALEDWLRAERELVWRPAVELRQRENEFELVAAVAGVEPKDLDIQVTSRDILIKAKGEHQHRPETSAVHLCEFNRGKLFRSIHLPDRIDPDSVKAEYRHGLLRLTARIAKAEPTRIDVQAA